MGGGAAFSFSGMSVISTSVVRIIAAIEAAFSSAERVTFAGSGKPASIIFSVLPVEHVEADVLVLLLLLRPADHIHDDSRRPGQRSRQGCVAALPGPGAVSVHRSPHHPPAESYPSASTAFNSATPPPGTIPSSMAARVAERASSTRVLRYLSSTSVPAPTLMSPTPPESLA